MLLDDVPGDRQSQPGPATTDTDPIDLVEALEDAALVGLRNADAMILHRQADLVTGRGDRHPDLRARTVRRRVLPGRLAAVTGGNASFRSAEFQGVVDEIDDDLAEPRLIAANRGHARRRVDDDPQSLAVGEEAQPLGRLDRDPAEVDVVEEDDRPATLDPGEVQQLVDHLDEMARLDLDLADPIAHLRRNAIAGRLRVPRQRLREEADGRQRRPELVGQVVDELGPDLLEAAQLGDVLEDDPHTADRRPTGAHDEDRALGAVEAKLAG